MGSGQPMNAPAAESVRRFLSVEGGYPPFTDINLWRGTSEICFPDFVFPDGGIPALLEIYSVLRIDDITFPAGSHPIIIDDFRYENREDF